MAFERLTSGRSRWTVVSGLGAQTVIALGLIVLIFWVGTAADGPATSPKKPAKNKPIAKITPPAEEPVSKVQQKIIESSGAPEQFILSYLADKGKEKTELVRTEVWFYPKSHKKITFVNGQVKDAGPTEDPGAEFVYTGLRPGDFRYSMNFDDIAARVGTAGIEPVNFKSTPAHDGADAESFMTENVLFTIKDGRLVYLETLARKP